MDHRESPRAHLLQTAIELTAGDRLQDYGPPVDTHSQIASIFNAITGHDLDARDVALMHVATKLARMRTSPRKSDSYVDAMAYLGIAYECAEGAE